MQVEKENKLLGYLTVFGGPIVTVALTLFMSSFNTFLPWSGIAGVAASLYGYFFFTKRMPNHVVLLGIVLNCLAVIGAEVYDNLARIAKGTRYTVQYLLQNFSDLMEVLSESGDQFRFWMYPVLGAIIVIVAGFVISSTLRSEARDIHGDGTPRELSAVDYDEEDDFTEDDNA